MNMLRTAGLTILVLVSVTPLMAQLECCPAPDGLVSWWPGEDDALDVVDGNHGVLFNGTSFLVDSEVSSSVDMDIYDFGLTWHVLNIDDLPVRVQFGPELSVKVVDADVSMVDHTTGLSESESLTAPVPTLGARARIGLSDWVALVGRVGYMEYDDNSFLDADAQIEFSPVPLVGIFAGYRYMDLEVDESGVFIDATLDGPYAGVLARF